MVKRIFSVLALISALILTSCSSSEPQKTTASTAPAAKAAQTDMPTSKPTATPTAAPTQEPTQEPTQIPTAKPTQPPETSHTVTDNTGGASDETTVWIGDTGTKYHYENCRTLKGNKTKITLKQALEQGREPCKVCH